VVSCTRTTQPSPRTHTHTRRHTHTHTMNSHKPVNCTLHSGMLYMGIDT